MAGRPILIDVSAPWCPTCKAQRPILSNLEAEPKFKDLLVLDVDFDSQKDVLRAFGVREGAALVLIVIGLVLVLPPLQARVAVAAGPVGAWTDRRFGGFSRSGTGGQFGLGLLLGAVWSPCVGPTLGAASALAAEGRDLARVALTMLLFGIGAALPLLVLGALSREAATRRRGRMLAAGRGLKAALGALLILGGSFVATGLDRRVETAVVDASPAWLTDATTRF